LGLRKQVEHYYNAAKPAQNTVEDNKSPWYVTNQTLHEDLNVPYITEVIQERIIQHHDKIKIHNNTTLLPLLEQQHRRRLKNSWPVDIIDG
jgi:hypothetical protein